MSFYSRTEQSKDVWETPKEFYQLLDRQFHFTLDPCASDSNHKCAKWFTEQQDGLKQSWKGETVFVNPPFNKNAEWLNKCYREASQPNTTVVAIIPSRTDTKYWHEIVMHNAYQVWFCKGRVNFELNGQKVKNGSTFPLAVIIFKITNCNPIYKSWDWKNESH
jgi:phage N-6-adenine-methyltransferase